MLWQPSSGRKQKDAHEVELWIPRLHLRQARDAMLELLEFDADAVARTNEVTSVGIDSCSHGLHRSHAG